MHNVTFYSMGRSMNEQLTFRSLEAMMDNADCLICSVQCGKHSETIVFGDFNQLRAAWLDLNHCQSIEDLKKIDGEGFYE